MTGCNPRIDGYAEHKGEYVDVFHDLTYLRNRWSRSVDSAAWKSITLRLKRARSAYV